MRMIILIFNDHRFGGETGIRVSRDWRLFGAGLDASDFSRHRIAALSGPTLDLRRPALVETTAEDATNARPCRQDRQRLLKG